MKKRIGILLTLSAVMAAMVALSAASAFASHNAGHNPGGGGGGNLPAGCTRGAGGTVTCVETMQRTFEETEELGTRTEFRESPAVAPCTVGQSGRVGTQQGIETQEVLITEFGVFEVVEEDVTTTVFQGNVGGQIISGPTTVTTEISRTLLREFEEEEVVGTTFTATGKCKNIPGPQPQARG
jgi:hypothetical protein